MPYDITQYTAWVGTETFAAVDHAGAHNAVQGQLTGPAWYNVKAYGAVGDGTTDDTTAIQNAIFAQQASGGIVFLPAGTYKVTNALVPAPEISGSAVSTRSCRIQGAGMYDTKIKRGGTVGTILGYGRAGQNPTCGQWLVSDLCLDGNYSGVDSGAYAAAAGEQLVSVFPPFTAPPVSASSGIYHEFSRVRFYRATGYGIQGANSIRCVACEFDRCGQPGDSVHRDVVGGGDYAEAVLLGCTFKGCDGNFVDFSAETSGKPCRLTMLGCTSFGHVTGGVYAAGTGSVIVGNELQNSTPGGGVGYDVSTHTANRSKNVVAHNRFSGLHTTSSGLTDTYGDALGMNIADDQSGTALDVVVQSGKRLLPSGSLVESFPRVLASLNTSGLTSGTLRMVAIELPAGLVVTTVNWMSGNTALATGTHQWAGLFDASRNKLRLSSDYTSDAWGTSTQKVFTLSSTYTIPTTGLYYVGLLVTASTMPTLQSCQSNTNLVGIAPIMAGSSSTGLTDPDSCPSQAAALTSISSVPYVSVG